MQANINPAWPKGSVYAIRLFTPAFHAVWSILAALAVLIETLPVPLMRPTAFYSYCLTKAFLFLLIGCGVPFSFWSFNALNQGLAFALVSAGCVEAVQPFVGRGHSFHWYELLAKVALLLLGFSVALNARYDREISWGRLRIRLDI